MISDSPILINSSPIQRITKESQKLEEQFMNLQQEWESYKQSYPKTKRRSFSLSSSTMAKTVDQLLDNSPRHLMNSLQHKMFPLEDDGWNVRTNDLAVEEIIRDRRAAMESGKLKGRRLLGDEHEEIEIGYGGEESEWGVWDDWDQESEVRPLSFCGSGDEEVESGKSKEIKVCFQNSISSLPSFPCGERLKDEEEKLVTMEEEEVVKDKEGKWERCIVVIMPVLTIAALIFAICRIRCLRIWDVHYEPILVPT